MDVITFPVNLLTTSGLSILLHGVISLSVATSYDKVNSFYTEALVLDLSITNDIVSTKIYIRKMLTKREMVKCQKWDFFDFS